MYYINNNMKFKQESDDGPMTLAASKETDDEDAVNADNIP